MGPCFLSSTVPLLFHRPDTEKRQRVVVPFFGQVDKRAYILFPCDGRKAHQLQPFHIPGRPAVGADTDGVLQLLAGLYKTFRHTVVRIFGKFRSGSKIHGAVVGVHVKKDAPFFKALCQDA